MNLRYSRCVISDTARSSGLPIHASLACILSFPASRILRLTTTTSLFTAVASKAFFCAPFHCQLLQKASSNVVDCNDTRMAASLLGKRGWCSASEEVSTATEDTTSSICSSQFGSSAGKKWKDSTSKVDEGHEQNPQFFVWEYHVRPSGAAPLAGQLQQPLQPADSSTTRTLTALTGLAGAAYDVLQQADQMDCDSRPAALVRTNSAPELLKLAQADSTAWHSLHAAGSAGAPQSAFLSHHDHWLT